MPLRQDWCARMQWEVRKKQWLHVVIASVAEELEEEAAEELLDQGAPVPAECWAAETLENHLTTPHQDKQSSDKCGQYMAHVATSNIHLRACSAAFIQLPRP